MIVSRKMAEEAAAVFGFDIASGLLDAQAVHAAYRTEAKRAHPDAGGTPEAFAAVDRAKHILLAWLDKQERLDTIKSHGGVTVCPRCSGDRRIVLQRGFRQMQVQCPTCQGNGELYDEKEKGVDRL